MFIHGGGFISWNSGLYQRQFRKITKDTGYPIFSVDYRLATDHPYPIPVSDWWQAYLWLRYYLEEYMQLTYDKIILSGDSAGGNLIIDITYLAILSKWIVPDGLVPIFPGLHLNRTYFVPTILNSLDEPILNMAFLDFCIREYDSNSKSNEDFLLSPLIAPDRMFIEDDKIVFPSTRMLITGNDPLRDQCFKYIIKLAKYGVDIKAVEYQYQLHGFIMFTNGPVSFPEAMKGVEQISNFITELAQIIR